jgi:hypothetical protein
MRDDDRKGTKNDERERLKGKLNLKRVNYFKRAKERHNVCNRSKYRPIAGGVKNCIIFFKGL